MPVDKRIPDIPDEIIESLARCILPAIQKYFECDEGQREFEKWKKKKDTKAVDMNNRPE